MQSIRELYKIGFGPSSSHTIGPVRAANIFIGENPEIENFRVTLFGSLAATGKGHYTDVAIEKTFDPKKVEIVWNANEELPLHPNGMLFEALNNENEIINDWIVYSIGGGDLKDSEGILNDKVVYDHKTLSDILDLCNKNGKTFWEYVEDCEGPEIWDFLKDVWSIMKDTITQGLDNEGVLPG
ncbi:MAG: serine dehydratase, partial [Bacteroidales bacterium]|nr:serine dehydratase [Bacteroidales bacterium]